MYEFENRRKELELIWKIFEFVRDNDDTYTDEEVADMVNNSDLTEKEKTTVRNFIAPYIPMCDLDNFYDDLVIYSDVVYESYT